MKKSTINKLNRINAQFYASCASEFDRTRQSPWDGWSNLEVAIARLRDKPKLKVLDVGCGNGRFGNFVESLMPGKVEYVGIDSSEELLTLAEAGLGKNNVELIRGDVVSGELDKLIDKSEFDLVVGFGLMHHVPGKRRRTKLLHQMGEKTAVGKMMVVSFWQFMRDERMRRRTIEMAELENFALNQNDLETNDYLLKWEQGGEVRYCHHFEREEIDELVSDLPVAEVARFEADGKSHDLNDYRIMLKIG